MAIHTRFLSERFLAASLEPGEEEKEGTSFVLFLLPVFPTRSSDQTIRPSFQAAVSLAKDL